MVSSLLKCQPGHPKPQWWVITGKKQLLSVTWCYMIWSFFIVLSFITLHTITRLEDKFMLFWIKNKLLIWKNLYDMNLFGPRGEDNLLYRWDSLFVNICTGEVAHLTTSVQVRWLTWQHLYRWGGFFGNICTGEVAHLTTCVQLRWLTWQHLYRWGGSLDNICTGEVAHVISVTEQIWASFSTEAWWPGWMYCISSVFKLKEVLKWWPFYVTAKIGNKLQWLEHRFSSLFLIEDNFLKRKISLSLWHMYQQHFLDINLQYCSTELFNHSVYHYSIVPYTTIQSFYLPLLNRSLYNYSIILFTTTQLFLLQLFNHSIYHYSTVPFTTIQSFCLPLLNRSFYNYSIILFTTTQSFPFQKLFNYPFATM